MEDSAAPAADGVAEWQVAGLYDPASPTAADRLGLLEYLTSLGATVEEMVEADHAGWLPGVAGHLVRRRGRTLLTPEETAERAGMDLETLARVARTSGLPAIAPGRPMFLESDVETFEVFLLGGAMFGEEVTLQFSRVIGASLSAIADAAMSTFSLSVQRQLDRAHAGELEQARAVAGASELLVEQVPHVIESLFFHHVEAASRRTQAAAGATTELLELSVGFLDLVGSTILTQELPADELGAAITEFEQTATLLVGGHDGRVVKTIGDEVMFVSGDASDACVIALELRDHVERHPVLPSLRGGIAVGGLVRGYGDYYGPIVNIAARAVKLADPGAILVTDEVCRRVADADGLRFEPAGERELRGFAQPVTLHVVERA